MPYTIPEWFYPGPEFMVAPIYGVIYPSPSPSPSPLLDLSERQVCFSANTIVYMSLSFHFGIILLSFLALMVHDRMQRPPSSKTDTLRYAPPLSE